MLRYCSVVGPAGSGKSSAIRQILRQVEQRGDSAIVYDPAMDFVGEFYSPERGDLILNPLDARCPWWDLKGELSGSEIAMTIAAAMLPDKEFEKSFFTDAPRRVLARLLLSQPTPADLVHWMSDPEEITERMKGTPQASLVDPGAPAQRAGWGWWCPPRWPTTPRAAGCPDGPACSRAVLGRAQQTCRYLRA